MSEMIIEKLHRLIERKNKQLVQPTSDGNGERTIEDRILDMHRRRGAVIVHSFIEGDVIRSLQMGNECYLDYYERNERLIKLKDTLYLEECMEYRRALFENGNLVEDDEVMPLFNVEEEGDLVEFKENDQRQTQRFAYNRYEAVRYAERWWDDYNPVYRRFTDNCTNFISQCLRAGGAPMTGYPNREKGWWFQGNNWSFSWSVAHSLRWHLSGSTSGLRGEERESARELQPGDVICYDFDGDGRWQHTTIVVAYDANGEPLVNAQTSNSRMRFWTYEDSTAWTPNIQYKFFHIG